MKTKGIKRAFSAFMAIFMLTANVYAVNADNSFAAEENYAGIGKIVMDMTLAPDELDSYKAEAKAELEALGADTAYNLSMVDLAASKNAIYALLDSAATEIGAEIINLPYNNTYTVENAEILYEGVSDEGKTLSDTSVIALTSSVITADGIGRAIVKAGDKKLLIKTEKANIALVLVTGQSNAAGAESDASLAPFAIGKYKGRFLITNSMNQAVSLSDITWDEARYEAEHGGAPSVAVAKGGWVGTARGAGTASSLGKRLSDEWNMAVWVVNTGFGGHPMEGFDPERTTHSDYTNTVNIVKKVKEVIASDRHFVLDNSKTGMFWIQGCSDGIGTESENTMAEYKDMFMNMYSGFKTELGINYAGIWLVRAGTYNNGDKDFYMSGPRMAQLYMANSGAEEYKNIHLVFNPDIWRTDAGVDAYFKAQYPDADAFRTEFGYDRPSSVNEVKPDIHYRQKGYNELGKVAGEVMVDILSGNAENPTGAALFGYDGNKIADTGFELTEGDSLITVPFATSYYNASFNLKVKAANEAVAKFDNETFTLKGMGEGETTVSIYSGDTILKTYTVAVEGIEEELDAVCYIGEDEASRVYYDTFMDAVKATNHTSVKTIHLLKDAIWEDYTYENEYGAHHRVFVLEGNGYELKLNQQMHISLNSNFTFNNVKVNLNTNYNILLGAGGKLTLGDNTVVKNANSDYYAIGLENRNGDGGALTLLSGSKVTGNKSNVLGIIYADCKSTIKIEGEITGNTSTAGAVRVNNSNVSVILGKNANVTGNTSKNIRPTAGTQVTIASDFTGTAGISFGGVGEAFAKFESGAVLTGINNDADDTLEIKTRKGNAIWKAFGEAEGKCYINDDTESLMSLHEAISEASSGSTIYVTDNITWDNVTTYHNKNLKITSVGGKKTVTMPATSNLRITGASGNITFENITIDFNFNGKLMAIDDGATVNLVSADVINGKGGVGGTIQLGAGTYGHLVMDENSLITGRATENAAVGAVVHLHGTHPTSTFTMNGGKIINYDSSSNRFAVAVWSDNSNSKIIISKNATIVNGTSSEATPFTGNADAISIKNANQLVLKGDFTGSIKVKSGAFGNVFGAAEDGATISGSLKSYTSGASATVADGKLIWLTDGDCYVGDNEYDKITLKDAIEKAPSGSVIHLVRDVTLKETIMLNRIGVNLTIDGTNGDNMYKVEFPITEEDELATANKRIFHIRNGYLTLNNVILSGGIHKDYGGSVIIEEASCSLTLTGKTEIRGAKATNGGAVWVRKGTLTVKDDALITGNTASMHGGAIYLTTTGGKVNLEGGKITGNFAPGGGGIYAGRDTNIYFKNDAYVYGNIANRETNAESNIIPENADIIVLNDNFTGKAGISFGKLSESFGKINGGSGEYNLISDADNKYYGYAEDGKLIWIPGQLKLSVEQDAGVAEGGKATIRFITNFDKADNLNALSYGTYIIPKVLFEDYEKDVYGSTENSLKAYFRSAKKEDAGFIAPKTGESFGVDYVEIPENAFDMEFVAVSFINLDGTYVYLSHGTVSVNGFGEKLKSLD